MKSTPELEKQKMTQERGDCKTTLVHSVKHLSISSVSLHMSGFMFQTRNYHLMKSKVSVQRVRMKSRNKKPEARNPAGKIHPSSPSPHMYQVKAQFLSYSYTFKFFIRTSSCPAEVLRANQDNLTQGCPSFFQRGSDLVRWKCVGADIPPDILWNNNIKNEWTTWWFFLLQMAFFSLSSFYQNHIWRPQKMKKKYVWKRRLLGRLNISNVRNITFDSLLNAHSDWCVLPQRTKQISCLH